MTNDTTTLNGALAELGETMADNLVTMGVSNADPSDGLTTLASKILSVPSGGGGLDLDTAVSLTSSSASIALGQSVTLTSVLSASYDSTVDLEGVLIGGTVSFKNGSTVIGTDATDSSGEASYTYTPAATGTYTLKAVFSGTSDFDACESSTVTLTVSGVAPASVSLTADKSILSYVEGQSATLSATVLDTNNQPLEDVTVTFYNGSTSMGTAQTNSSGVATKTYTSAGAGELTFTAQTNNITGTCNIEDIYFYNTLTSDDNLFTRVQGGATIQYSTNGLKYTGTQNVDCIHKLNYDLPDGSYTLECDVTDINSSGYSTAIGTEDAMVLRGNNGLYARKISTSGDFFNGKSFTLPFHLKIVVTGTTSKSITYYRDGTSLGSGSNITRNKELVLRSYNNRMIQIKNLKIYETS